MEINIEGSPKEIKELLQAIASSKEYNAQNLNLDGEKLARIIHDPESMECQNPKEWP